MFQLPVLFMLISIFLYSLFPLVGVFGTGEISGFAFAGLSHMLSAAVSLLGALMLSGTSTEYGFRRLFHDLREDRSALRFCLYPLYIFPRHPRRLCLMFGQSLRSSFLSPWRDH